MKRLTTILLILVVALATQDVDAKRLKRRSHDPLTKLVEMIAAGNHWSQTNLAKMGLTKLFSEVQQEEYGESELFVYGKNATATIADDGTTILTATGANAFAIEVVLTTDNGTAVYFKEKADHDRFMALVRKSRHYKRYDQYEALGTHTIENDGIQNDWYVITFHGG